MNNTRVLLASRPVGLPARDDWTIETVPAEGPGEGEFLAEVLYVSLDPAMRGWVKEGKSYLPPVGIGEVMRAGGVARVLESRHPDFAAGDHVLGTTGVQSYWRSNGKGVRKVDPNAAPLPKYLGVLGMPGMTAYFGILDVGAIREGETVLVSGAAGAVGSLVGQIAKIKGCHVVGIAGGREKCDYLTGELGFDTAIDYKSESLYPAIKAACPKGIDVYFDNVGGPITDAVFPLLNERARISVCGQISQYNLENPELGPRIMWHFIVKRLTMRGFLVFDFAAQYRAALTEMAEWVRDGKIQYREDIWEGLENAPAAFIDMMKGGNVGKRLIKVAQGN